MPDFRLGDVIDDYCVKCRRVTNHSIVSLVDGAAAKVRCRTCYNDHDYRHEQAPPSKKDLKKAELFKQVLANAGGAGGDGAQPPDAISEIAALVSDAAIQPLDPAVLDAGPELPLEEAAAEAAPPAAKAKTTRKRARTVNP